MATFQDLAFYKYEAYDANLRAGKILSEHGVPVAYKSDHFEEDTNAKYLLFQAAGAHSFGLPADLALQAVTSVPAKSIQQDHRIGFAKPGYDADIVVWDSHPLSVGATPVSVFIDGKSALPKAEDEETSVAVKGSEVSTDQAPRMRPSVNIEERSELCNKFHDSQKRLVVTGIKKSFMEIGPQSEITTVDGADQSLTMVVESGKITCLSSSEDCIHDSTLDSILTLGNGYVLPGLTVVNTGMGLREFEAEDETSDGRFTGPKELLDPVDIAYAKYGVHLEGKGFQRARIGGVTRSISSPLSSGSIVRGVSTGIKTTGNKTILDGGIFQEDVAIHFVIGQSAKGSKSRSTIS